MHSFVHLIGYLTVSAALLGSAYLLRPMTPTDRCRDLSITVERRTKDEAFELLGATDPQHLYTACIAAALTSGGGR